MRQSNFILLGLTLTLFSCKQPTEKVSKDNLFDSAQKISNTKNNIQSNISDTSNQYIYDFMKVAIAEQKLNLSYGLTLDAEQGCDLSQDDKTFLKSLLIEKTQPKIDTGDWRNATVTVSLYELPKCLTKSDINEMLLQKQKLSKFTWDNSRLGFNISNNKNWYCFSIPLFSRDKKNVVMMIRELCPGLCGTARTMVFTKENKKWVSATGGQWIH